MAWLTMEAMVAVEMSISPGGLSLLVIFLIFGIVQTILSFSCKNAHA
jgi:hypothetical protein